MVSSRIKIMWEEQLVDPPTDYIIVLPVSEVKRDVENWILKKVNNEARNIKIFSENFIIIPKPAFTNHDNVINNPAYLNMLI